MYIIKEADNPALQKLAASLIRELAVYESLEDICTATSDDIEELFSDGLLHALLAFDEAGEAAGILTYFYMVSTFYGKRISYMDDLFIREKFRGNGLGKKLITEWEGIGRSKNCCKLEWKCLTWNKPAQNFYKNFGGIMDDKNLTYYKILADE
ncbi:GNAT family N-acetyltransferase [Pectinatus haikarae]|uniref:GNAT superfamily N-acetyltransferase n=1 Tax=Pectinatus haikarae TaxID=349096 RepID=A0ABT9Y6V1_9FIRM|nr:GNAT family N-acetyltransferase [Pectinatus haikarae]MDQ0203554.1 GNAT superfamily N-acetyltransferase [Pectinatus haikarae]